MKTIYKAFDGTEFETIEECKKYEKFHDYKLIKMLDEDYSPTANFSLAYFILIYNDLDKQIVKNKLDSNGYTYDDIKTIPTVLAWDGESSKWKDIPSEIERLQEKLTKLKEILSMVEENEG